MKQFAIALLLVGAVFAQTKIGGEPGKTTIGSADKKTVASDKTTASDKKEDPASIALVPDKLLSLYRAQERYYQAQSNMDEANRRHEWHRAEMLQIEKDSQGIVDYRNQQKQAFDDEKTTLCAELKIDCAKYTLDLQNGFLVNKDAPPPKKVEKAAVKPEVKSPEAKLAKKPLKTFSAVLDNPKIKSPTVEKKKK